jgi:hypothetical protein
MGFGRLAAERHDVEVGVDARPPVILSLHLDVVFHQTAHAPVVAEDIDRRKRGRNRIDPARRAAPP